MWRIYVAAAGFVLALRRVTGRAARAAALAPGMRSIGPKRLADSAVKGHLFDVDGTLIDTMPLFFHSWTDVCGSFGLSITEHQFYGYAGLPLPEIVRRLHQTAHGTDPPEGFTERFLRAKKSAHAANEERLGHPPPIGVVAQIARDAVATGQPVCVATSGLRDHVEAHLASAGLADLFPPELIVTAADVPKGKPAPDIYLEAARRIGVRAEDCRAYEDGESGLVSAYKAGCHTIDVTCADAYPSCEGLRAAKLKAEKERDWL